MHFDLLLLLNFMYEGEVTVAQKELSSFLKAGEDLRVKGLGDRARGSGKEEVLVGAQEQRVRGAEPKAPFEVALVKTETGSMEAGLEERAWGAQNTPDEENNSQDYKEEFGREEGSEVKAITNPSNEQRKQVFDPYMKTTLKDGKLVWQCLVCDKEFVWKRNVCRHVEAVHVNHVFRYNCRYCSKVLNSLKQKENHKTVHKNHGV